LEAKKAGYATVAIPIAGDFVLPILAVFLRHAAVPAAAVPKAPIHEDNYPLAPKDKVRAAGEWLVPAPASDAGGAKDRRQF
jgi:hypothetical protein